MPTLVVIHRLKDFDGWLKQFEANPPPPIGRWRVMRGIDDRNRVHIIGEVTSAEVKGVKDFLASAHMQDVLGHANEMSTAPIEVVWLDELAH